MTDTVLLTLLIFLAALLFSSVGHAGASGYLAALALFNRAPEVMKPTALTLNLIVAIASTLRFTRAGCFEWKLFWPFALLSVPLAFVGGAMDLAASSYQIVLGLVLLFAAWWLAFKKPVQAAGEAKPVSLPLALVFGAVIGLLSGLTGVGGGIFLSPLLQLLGWADPRKTAGISAAFILVNSAAGLLGHLASLKNVPQEIVWWAPAALAGGILGAELGEPQTRALGLAPRARSDAGHGGGEVDVGAVTLRGSARAIETALNVAAGILPAVEPGFPARRKNLSCALAV